MFRTLTAFTLATFAATGAHAILHTPPPAVAEVRNADDMMIGTVYAKPSASGVVSLTIALTNLPEGALGVHLHERGSCAGENFEQAGGHIAGGKSHGINSEDGPHPGDLPNIIVGADGTANVEYFLYEIDIDRDLIDGTGAAFIVHSGPDDYTSQPAGNSGTPIACGVFEANPEG